MVKVLNVCNVYNSVSAGIVFNALNAMNVIHTRLIAVNALMPVTQLCYGFALKSLTYPLGGKLILNWGDARIIEKGLDRNNV